MMDMPTIKRIREIEGEYYVKDIDSDELLTQVYELRYQVYCTERGFLPGHAGLE